MNDLNNPNMDSDTDRYLMATQLVDLLSYQFNREDFNSIIPYNSLVSVMKGGANPKTKIQIIREERKLNNAKMNLQDRYEEIKRELKKDGADITQLNSESGKIEVEIVNINDKLKELAIELENLAKKPVIETEASTEVPMEHVIVPDDSIDTTKENTKKYQAKIIELGERMDQLRQTYKSSSAEEKVQIKSDFEKLQQQSLNVKNQLEQALRKVAESSAASEKERADAAELMIKSLENKINRSARRNRQRNRELQNEKEKMVSAEEKIRETTKQLKQVQEELSKAELEIVDLERDTSGVIIEQQRATIVDLRDELQRKQAESEAAQQDAASVKINLDKVTEKNKKIQDEINAQATQIEEYLETISKLEDTTAGDKAIKEQLQAQLDELSSQIVQKQLDLEEANRLRDESETLQQNMNALRQDAELNEKEAKEKLKATETLLEQLREKYSERKAAQKAVQAEAAQLQKILRDTQKERDVALVGLDEIQKAKDVEAEAARVSLDDAIRERDEESVEKTKAQQERLSVEQNLRDTREELEDEKGRAEELEVNIMYLQDALNKNISAKKSIEKELGDARDEAQRIKEETKAKMVESNAEIEKLNEKIQELEMKLDKKSMEDIVDIAIKEGNKRKLEIETQQQIRELKEEIERLKGVKKLTETESKALEIAMENAEKGREVIQMKLLEEQVARESSERELNEEIETLKAAQLKTGIADAVKNRSLGQKINELTQEVENSEEEVRKIRMSLVEAQKKANLADRRFKILKVEHEGILENLKETQTILEQTKKELDEKIAITEVGDAIIFTLQDDLEKNAQKYTELLNKATKMKARKDKYKSRSKTLEEDNERLKKDTERLNDMIEDAKKYVERMKELKEFAEENSEAQSKKAREAEEELQFTEKQLVDSRKRERKLSDKNAELELWIADNKITFERQGQDLISYEVELEDAHEELRKLNETINKLKQANMDNNKMISELLKTNDELTAQINELERENEELRTAISGFEVTFKRQNEFLIKLQDNLENKESELALLEENLEKARQSGNAGKDSIEANFD